MNKEEKRAYDRNRYQWLKEHHICVGCGEREAFHKFVRCEECLYKKNEYAHKNLEKTRIGKKAWVEKTKAEGRCVCCGKERDGKSIRYCNACLEKIRKYKNNWQNNKRAQTKMSEEELHNLHSNWGKINIKYAISSNAENKGREKIKKGIEKIFKIAKAKKFAKENSV